MSEQRPPLSLSLQLLYLALFECGTVCALWEKGHFHLTLGVILSQLLFVGLSRFSPSRFPILARQLIQLIMTGIGIAWFWERSPYCPMDISLLEGISLMLSPLFLGCRLREHQLIILISLIYGAYGALTPGRALFLPSLLLVIFFILLILLKTRLTSCSKRNLSHLWGAPFASNTLFILLSTLLCLFCLYKIPIKVRLFTRGVIPISFSRGQTLWFRNTWGQWRSTETESDPQANLLTDAINSITSLAEKSSVLIKDNQQNTMDAAEGNGGAGIGKDLVFRAFSQAKLYWLVQAYDTYDGTLWSRSKELLSFNNPTDNYYPPYGAGVIQNISIQKAVSFHLPYTYRKVSAMLTSIGGVHPHQLTGTNQAILQQSQPLFLSLSSTHFPKLPWNYTVFSIVPSNIPSQTPAPQKRQKLPRSSNYLQLPPITPRIRELAARLTEGKKSDKEKADALQHYLRTSYSYTLEVPPLPEGEERVDNFLFVSKKGCCQQFAQALVILARASGLQARLATGFLPGKYNLLTGCFDVYEYHAHAWAQIFVFPYGWLTYDGTPPGELNPQDTGLISSMLDPFGEKWHESPPELSYTPPHAMQRNIQEFNRSALSHKIQLKFFDELKKTAAEYSSSEKINLNTWLKALGKTSLKRLSQFLRSLLHAAWTPLKHGCHFIRHHLWSALALLLIFCNTLWLLYHYRKPLRNLGFRLSCLKIRHQLHSDKQSPLQRITQCQKLNDRLLTFAGSRFSPQNDLMERAATLTDPTCRQLALKVAQTTAKSWYSNHPIPLQELQDAITACDTLYNTIIHS